MSAQHNSDRDDSQSEGANTVSAAKSNTDVEALARKLSGRQFSRRAMLTGSAGGALIGAASGFASGYATRASQMSPSAIDLNTSYAFYGKEVPQAGIETEPQRNCMFTTFEMNEGTTRQDLQILLARWSAAISLLQAGKPIGPVQPRNENGVPADTGEATDLDPAALTVTVGLGPALFDDRFGLSNKRPALLTQLPAISGDRFKPELTGGDLSLQVCADDPQVVYHATRNLSRLARTTVTPGWSVTGFGRASAGPHQHTPRNLMGFKDGTRNVDTPQLFDEWVWVKDSDQAWMRGGSYQVARKIAMNIENWDADYIGDQEAIFGRRKQAGEPLTGKRETDTPDFKKLDSDGNPVISAVSHIALVAHENNGGVRILRRSYNFTDGRNDDGQLNAGLLFLAYTKDPGNFVTLQRRLGASDLLNEYISHIGSGLFAVPPAPQVGHFIGEDLFKA